MELSLKGIWKSFGAGNVLENVDFSVRGGEINALLGENGAGKSTLMNIAGGVLSPDRGGIFLDGLPEVFHGPAESLRAGIAFIHQELNLVNDLTVYENMFLAGFEKKGLFLDKAAMQKKTAALFEKLGIAIDPSVMVGELDASYKQMVEIARALLSDASVIIMDEPTASLTAPEIERIFAIMRNLKKQGIAMIFISHKLGEVMEICDTYTILRNGRMVKSGSVKDVTVRELASAMVGHSLSAETRRSQTAFGAEVLRIENLSDGKNFRDISLAVKKGEILGVTGLMGDGRSELFETVFGLHGSGYEGKILLEGEEIHPRTTDEALRRGIAYLPKNRKENGIIGDMSILDNGTVITLDRYRKRGLLKKDAQKKDFDREVRDLHIKMSDARRLITGLSGGNQQKVVLSKWLLAEPKLLILDNPTQGVDVGAKEEIYIIIESLAAAGMAIVILSSEAQEIMRVCQRSLVLYHGALAGEVSGDGITEENIMYLATGGGKEAK